jgi:hypothetical protein
MAYALFLLRKSCCKHKICFPPLFIYYILHDLTGTRTVLSVGSYFGSLWHTGIAIKIIAAVCAI